MQASRCVYIEDVHAEENSRNNTSRPRETLWILSSEHVKPFFEVKKLFLFLGSKVCAQSKYNSWTQRKNISVKTLSAWNPDLGRN